jgi:hypothetical protein
VRKAALGHGAAIVCGLSALAVFGLWHHPSVAAAGRDSTAQILAQALAVGITLLLLSMLKAHHPPAAASTLLIASGIAAPGRALLGMIVGLVAVIGSAAALSVIASFRGGPTAWRFRRHGPS